MVTGHLLRLDQRDALVDGQEGRRGRPGHAGADHRDVEILVGHLASMTVE
jgi:hypothetical protein